MRDFTKKQLSIQFGDMVKFNESLARHCTFKIGGPAEVFITPQTSDDLIEVLEFVVKNNLVFIILGGGTNVVCPDAGIAGVVISPQNKEIKINDVNVSVGAGESLSHLAIVTAEAGLAGLEWGISVPGTVGGAIYGNAGAFGGETKDCVLQARIFSGDRILTLTNDQLEFKYRSSRIKKYKGKEQVIDVIFQLKKDDPQTCKSKVKELLDKKFESQPMGEACAGCMFKNIELTDDVVLKKEVPQEFIEKRLVYAGWIIENLGLKGFEKNGVKVSEKHANFLINTGTGTSASIREMVEFIKQKVYHEYGLILEEEVQFI